MESGTDVDAARCTIDVILCCSIRRPIKAASPTSSETSSTSGGTSDREPVDRSSTTTQGLPRSRSASTTWLPM